MTKLRSYSMQILLVLLIFQLSIPGTASAQTTVSVNAEKDQTAAETPFNGYVLYQKTFQAILQHHIELTDGAARANWAAEWEHKHDKDGALDTEDGADKACLEMVRSLNQRFDYYLPPELTQEERLSEDPSLVGIGVNIILVGQDDVAREIFKKLPPNASGAQRREAYKAASAAVEAVKAAADHPIIITRIFEGGPADKAGLKPEDRIMSVDGTSIYGLTLQEVVTRVKGKPGTMVSLTVRRAETDVTVSIERARVIAPVVHTKDLGDGTTLIRIDNFESRYVVAEMHAALIKAVAGRSIVLDLRGNPGGDVSYVVAIASMLIGEGNIIVTRRREGDNVIVDRYFLTPDLSFATSVNSAKPDEVSVSTEDRTELMIPESMPLVLLVSQYSYSGAEELSGALQKTRHSPVVGMPTGGKGVGQTVVDLPFDRTLHVTSFQFLPAGVAIDWVGVIPDVEVENAPIDLDNPKAFVDEQLATARRLLKGQLEKAKALEQRRQDLRKQKESEFQKRSLENEQ